LERVNYFPRQIMTVDDMVAEADYFCEKLRRHNRYLHGWGVVCGLGVTGPTADGPATVKIDSGYALGPYGDEIYVADPVTLDLARCGDGAHTDPCEPSRLVTNGMGSGAGNTVFVAIRYFECVAKPVRAMPAGCACDEQDCEYSRIRDSFEISCLTQEPPKPQDSLCDLLNQVVPCPPPPSSLSPWVVLARVDLSAGGGIMNIDTKVRRQIFSTSQIQTSVIKCCCGPVTPLPQLLLQVGDVIFRGDNLVLDVNGSPFLDAQAALVSTSELQQARTIEVKFANAKLDPASVSPENFKVVTSENRRVDGTLDNSFDDHVIWTATESAPFQSSSVDYTLILIGGDGTESIKPITSKDGIPLDGDFHSSFPSGDGKAGGDFKLNFHTS